MTKTTRKTVCLIALIFVVVAVFVFIAWGTSGFTNWNASTWFDYWGKGASTVTTPDKPDETDTPETQALAAAAAVDAGLIYDSDDGVYTMTVQKLQAPVFTDIDFSGDTPTVKIIDPNASIEHNLVYKVYGFGSSTVLFTYDEANNSAEDVVIDVVADIADKYGYDYLYTIQASCTSNSGEYSDSNRAPYMLYIPHETYISPTFSQMYSEENNVVKVVMPYDYHIKTTAANSFDSTLKIDVGVTDEFGVLSTDEGLYINNYSMSEDVYSGVIRDPVGIKGYEYLVHLERLPFINEPRPYCVIRVRFNFTFKNPQLGEAHVCCKQYADYAFSVSKLATPTNIRRNGYYLEWDDVSGAMGYAVFINSDSTDVNDAAIVDESTYYLGESLSNGTYVFRIRALGNVGKQLSETNLASLTPYNASMSISQLVVLNYSVDGDVVSKFVPYGSTAGDYLYDVELPNKEFGGWFYDNGYSVKVEATDTINKDVTIYARLSDVKVTDRPLSWWDQYKWYVLIPAISVAAIALIAGCVIYVKKKKAA